MHLDDLKDKTIAIWGMGAEGAAVAKLLQTHNPDQSMVFLDNDPTKNHVSGAQIKDALNDADIIIKSPGISLYHPDLPKDKPVTSLINLWFAQERSGKTICITGTKGKSTTASLLAHVLQKMSKKTALIGNIGTPLTEASDDHDFYVIEVSSYQAANFNGACDIGIVTNLYPEHLDWHGTLTQYYRDKTNILTNAKIKMISAQAKDAAHDHSIELDGQLIQTAKTLPQNDYLKRAHNHLNVAAVLSITDVFGFDQSDVLGAMADYAGLPHRQFTLGERNGILYVDDSISTTAQSAVAAITAFAGRPITLIVGGFDRGIDYTPLIQTITHHKIQNVICLGPAGQRMHDALKNWAEHAHMAKDMKDAVHLAHTHAAEASVILLSPGAPSYGMFKDFKERGKTFAYECGF